MKVFYFLKRKKNNGNQDKELEEKANSKSDNLPKKTPNNNMSVQDRNQLVPTSPFCSNIYDTSYSNTTTSLHLIKVNVSAKISNSTSNIIISTNIVSADK